jgi:hypothetical protein
VEQPAAEVEVHSRWGRLELEKHREYLSDREFASLQFAEAVLAFVAGFAGADIGYNYRFVVLLQGTLGWLPTPSYQLVGTVVEELHRHRLIAAAHRPLVGFCQYKSSRQYRHHSGRWMIKTGILSTQAPVEASYSRRWYVDCTYSKDVLQASDHNTGLQ